MENRIFQKILQFPLQNLFSLKKVCFEIFNIFTNYMGSVEAAKVINTMQYEEKYSQDKSGVPSLPISKKDEKNM